MNSKLHCHALIYVQYHQRYKCDGPCFRKFLGNKSWRCQKCDFDLCAQCYLLSTYK